jgi:dTDP-4-dehydrorhamnose 3,5-epimerase
VIFRETAVAGVWIVEPEPRVDERGFFARTWCAEEFRAHGLNGELAQVSVSYNHRRGTLRGLHYQAAPHAEAKLVRCTRGAIWDVAVDLRPESPTFLRHAAVVLDADNRLALYVPEGCAHGFQTLADASEVLYQMSTAYVPPAARGVRWDDPAFAIPWPPAERIIAARDRAYPDFRPDHVAVH